MFRTGVLGMNLWVKREKKARETLSDCDVEGDVYRLLRKRKQVQKMS